MQKIILLLSIIIIASFLRLYNLTPPAGGLPPGLYPDEAMNGNNAIEAFANKDWKVFYPENNGREGLFINIQSLFMATLGNEAWALRLPSVIFGILTVLGLYFLTRELFRENSNLEARNPKWFGELTILNEVEGQIQNPNSQISKPFRISRSEALALLSSFLFATSFWQINFSRIGFRAIMAPFFLIWALYFLLRALNANRYTLYAILGGLFYGLGFYSYIAYRATPILLVLVLWVVFKKYGRKITFKIGSIFIAVAILITLPLGIYFLTHSADFLGRTAQISIFSSSTPLKDLGLNILKTAGMFNFVGDGNWRHNIAGRPLLFWPVGVLFLIGFVLSLIKFIRPKLEPRNWGVGILLAWLVIAALPVIVSNEGLPHALRAILMAPPVFILAAVGGLKTYDLLKLVLCRNRLWLPVACFLFLFLLIFEAYVSYFITWGQNPNTAGAFNQDYVEIAYQLNVLPKELPKYVVVEAPGVIVRGVPMPAQTVMFITGTFDLEKRKEKNIIYLLPDQLNQIDDSKEHFITFVR